MMLARTLIVVTADHGESFGEHGEETHGVFVYDATLRVPFIVAAPGIHRRALVGGGRAQHRCGADGAGSHRRRCAG